MYKICTGFKYSYRNCITQKSLLIMKLTIVLTLAAFLQATAGGFAQKLSLNEKNARIEKVFKEIKRQADYNFFYDLDMLQESRPVSISVKNASIQEVLERCFDNQPFTFVIAEKTIVVKRKAQTITGSKHGQDISVTGRVVDEEGAPLPGVSVKLKGGSAGATTSVDGRFTINAPENGVLVFSFIGYQSQEVSINGQSSINVKLVAEQKALSEVVVVGYGTQRRTSVVSAVDQISASALAGRPSVNTTQALQGVSANLVVQQRNSEPGGGVNINIRGISTLGNNSPLVVIDGIVGGDINLLNPADIETVSILKDAGSAAIYGSRASNGVILISTKMGKKNSRTALAYTGLTGINDPKMFFKPVSGYENAILRNEAAANAGLGSAVYSPEQIRSFQDQGDKEWFVNTILENALQQNHNLSLTGGSQNSSYLVSVGYTDQQSNFVGPDKGLKRYNYRINMSNEYGKLKFISQLAYTKSIVNDHSSSTSTLMVDAARVPLYYEMKDDQGRYLTNDVLAEFNPLGVLEKGGFRRYNDDNLFGTLNAEFALTKHLKLRGVFGGSLKSNSQFARSLQVNYFPGGVSGADRNTNDESRKIQDLNAQFLTQYTRTFLKNHDVDVLLGISNENHEERGSAIYRRFTDPDLGTPVTGTIIAENSYNSNGSSGENSLNSFFGRTTYSYKNKYYGEFNFRYDGSSKFRKGNRWGFFPAFSAGYRLSEEGFMEDYRNKVGNLKLRASYGIVGNQNVGNYQYQTTFFSIGNIYGFGNEAVAGTGFNFSNPDLKWERAATLNLGSDFTFFRDALTFSFDYFNKTTRDILVPPAVPGVFGTNLPDFNAGEVRSYGWEASVAYRKSGKQFRHNVSFNLGDAQNKVLYFAGNERLTGVEELQILLKEGYPYRSYVGLKRDGYFQNIDEVTNGPKPAGLNVQPGDNRYVDVNGDGIIDNNDLHVFGNPFPRFTYGFMYNVGFKNFDLNLFVQGVGKRTMMLRGELIEPYHFNYGMTMYQHQLDYWTPQNPNAQFPRLASNGSQSNENNFRRGSNMYLFNAAYARLKNVQVGYTLPQALSKKLAMQKLRIYMSGQNLLTLSKLKFVDPELSEFDSNLNNAGANSGRAYPTMVYYGFGLDVTF